MAPVFITGNINKLNELQLILGANIKIRSMNFNLPEIQGDPHDIIREKALYASNLLNKSVIVEDTSLCFNALNGMPGPYIKSFYEKIGNEGLVKLLDGYTDKTIYALCLFAYVNKHDKDNVMIFEGRCNGTIVKPTLTSKNGFGWDPIFLPDNFDRTFAELDSGTKNMISHRSIALCKLVEYLKNQKRM